MLLQAHFVVLWSMKLDRRGHIRSVSVKEITLENRSFGKLDDETRKRFNINEHQISTEAGEKFS
jgi:hypothetical protein